MRIARVIGSAVSTIKAETLRGTKLLVVQTASTADELIGDEVFVAVDAIGAGQGELVLISEGSAARHTPLTAEAPVDAVILAILDSLEVGGDTTFRKS
ncbi:MULTISPECIES: EutN/CcmL family microcompartment protein [unclassified Tessaracoccus]|uniref:EutN/CcmL family microcompartment protein n=1 Tax=unclassified Tessaracoccus TaxID=2635419 RepID=UPI00096D12B4|nr:MULTISPECIES: EutN/CcmL family microcompartment protein [unclassified Tessaracoccus]MBB1508862.1 EutN/CcmL family microcompartment protein [Tessaracoccus sp. MC1756]MCG6566135.1 ethanolamine utilization protein EutN [Tessaracoccus sp. ZS01]OMG58632.1 ethanolamine utilization protein EutN [Tessaracoccus sp. ZS01]